MAKPKKAKLKANDVLLIDNGTLDQHKPVVLNIAGKTDTAVGANKLRVQVRVFYRANGIPFRNTIFDGTNAAGIGADTDFDIDDLVAERPSFTPRHKTLHSFRVLSWDISANQNPKKIRDVRSHVVRLRVK
jgi:hypothetical protein